MYSLHHFLFYRLKENDLCPFVLLGKIYIIIRCSFCSCSYFCPPLLVWIHEFQFMMWLIIGKSNKLTKWFKNVIISLSLFWKWYYHSICVLMSSIEECLMMSVVWHCRCLDSILLMQRLCALLYISVGQITQWSLKWRMHKRAQANKMVNANKRNIFICAY